jgi:3-oxoacyl-[acyl-carrier-protein] synthase-3
MMRSRVVATGRALGSEKVDNATLAGRLGTTPISIERRTGIKTRYWVKEGESTADLAVRAAQEALQRAGWTPASIDLIVLSTTSPDYPFPSTACLVQYRLAADRAYAFDLNASCSGFLYALSVADHAIRSGGARRALVIASEVKSPFLRENDLSTQILFGDGAGALLLEGAEGARDGIEAIFLHADGSKHHLVRLPAGGSRDPLSPRTLSEKRHSIRMNGTGLFRSAVRFLSKALDEATGANWDKKEIDWFVFHQANGRILETVAKREGIPMKKVILTLREFGNTSSSSLPIALDKGGTRLFRPGDKILLVSFGGGITWGATRLVWSG